MAQNTVSTLGKVNQSLQVSHLEAVGHGGSGGKVFATGDIRSTAGNIAATTGALTLGATSNQLVLGTTNTTTISATAPGSSLTLTIPAPAAACNVQLGLRSIVSCTAGALTTLTAADSGKVVFVPQATVDDSATVNAIQLPAPTAGFNIRIIFTTVASDTTTQGWRIMSTGDNMVVDAVAVDAGLVSVHDTVTNIRRTGVANNARAGDYIDIVSNGTLYFAFAFASGDATPWALS